MHNADAHGIPIGGPPGPRPTPSSACWHRAGIRFNGRLRVQGVRPTMLVQSPVFMPIHAGAPAGNTRVRATWLILTVDIDRRYDRRREESQRSPPGYARSPHSSHPRTPPLHGVGVSERIEQVTKGVFVVGPGSLFPALHRLAENGWVEGQWGQLENGRRAKFYALTPSGRTQLTKEKRHWLKVNTAVNQVLADEA